MKSSEQVTVPGLGDVDLYVTLQTARDEIADAEDIFGDPLALATESTGEMTITFESMDSGSWEAPGFNVHFDPRSGDLATQPCRDQGQLAVHNQRRSHQQVEKTIPFNTAAMKH